MRDEIEELKDPDYNIKKLVLPSKHFVTWDEFDILINYLVAQIEVSGKKYNRILTFKRGGLIPAVVLSHRLGITNLTIERQRVFIIVDDKLLVVDDITDSGETLIPYAGKDDTLTLYGKTTSEVKPTYCPKWVMPQVWVVFPWENKDAEMKRDRET